MRGAILPMSILGTPCASCCFREANSEWRMANRKNYSLLPIRYSPFRSHPLNDRRGAHAGADAQGHQRGREVAAFQFVEHGAEDHGAGGAERMAHGDGAAVDVDL